MATYEYECKKCKKIFQVTGSYSTLFGLKPECPDCRSKKVRKVFHPTAFYFKGDKREEER